MAIDSRRVSLLMPVFVFSLLFARFLIFLYSPQERLITIIPDDAFYYIKMAIHRAEDGVWTFDGQSPATGFHFLYAYFLVFLVKIFPGIDWIGLYIIVGVFSCLSIAASVHFLNKAVTDLYGGMTIFAATLPFLSAILIMQGTVMMESWLVIFFSAITLFLVVNNKELSFKILLVSFFVGFLGSLSRTDYGMLPGVLFCTIFFFEKFKFTPVVIRSFSILMGALLGVLVILMQNYLISGHFAQASAQTKLFWSSVAGHSVNAGLQLIFSIIFPVFDHVGKMVKGILLVSAFLVLIFSGAKSFKFFRSQEYPMPVVIFWGCALTLVGYILFYRHNSGALQPWYSSNIVVPVAILISGAFSFVLGAKMFMPLVFIFAAYSINGLRSVVYMPWPHQAGMMNAGKYIKDFNGNSSFAAWNAGIIGYFSGRAVVNIDGLTNDDILPYIKKNNLMGYLKKNKIKYIVDYRAMMDNKIFRLRGGYEDRRVFDCITPIKSIAGNAEKWMGSELFLFQVDGDCL